MVLFGTRQMISPGTRQMVRFGTRQMVSLSPREMVWFGTREMVWFGTRQMFSLARGRCLVRHEANVLYVTRLMVWFGTRQMVWFGYLLGRSLLADIRPSARLFAVMVLELPVLVRHARISTVTEIFTVAWKNHAIIPACHAKFAHVTCRAKNLQNHGKIKQTSH